MPRNTGLLVLAVLFSMLGFWYFKSMPRVSEPMAPAVALVPAAPPVKKTTSDRPEIQRAQAEKELALLQTQWDQESQKLEIQKKILEQLRQSHQITLGAASFSSQINTRALEIQNLIEALGSYRQAEEEINRTADVAIRNQDSGARIARDQIETRIQSLEQEIHNTQNELNYWRNYPAGLDVLKQKPEMERLQDQLGQQRSELLRLRSQRVDISAQVLNNSQSIQALTERAKEELRSAVADTQEEIFSLRSEIDRLQGVQSQTQSQLRVLNSQIANAEKDFEEQSRRVRSLEDSIRTKKAESRSQ